MTTPAVADIRNISALRRRFGHRRGQLRLAFQYSRITGPLHRYAAFEGSSEKGWHCVNVAMGKSATDAARALAEKLIAAGYEAKE